MVKGICNDSNSSRVSCCKLHVIFNILFTFLFFFGGGGKAHIRAVSLPLSPASKVPFVFVVPTCVPFVYQLLFLSYFVLAYKFNLIWTLYRWPVKCSMAHSIRGWACGWQVYLCDPSLTRATLSALEASSLNSRKGAIQMSWHNFFLFNFPHWNTASPKEEIHTVSLPREVFDTLNNRM